QKAIEALESIVSEIERGDMDVDLLAEKVKRAAFLSQYCKTKLRKTGEELKVLLENIDRDETGDNPDPTFL
ncbi:MAG: exodeoxyribonuclease VII small subunit, partial [Atribacterota bacterium]